MHSWYYQSEDELDTSSSDGQITSYGGGGFVQDLSPQRNIAEKLVADLFDGLWLNRGTRAVLIDFTVYNANINLFCVIKYVMIPINPTNFNIFVRYVIRILFYDQVAIYHVM